MAKRLCERKKNKLNRFDRRSQLSWKELILLVAPSSWRNIEQQEGARVAGRENPCFAKWSPVTKTKAEEVDRFLEVKKATCPQQRGL